MKNSLAFVPSAAPTFIARSKNPIPTTNKGSNLPRIHTDETSILSQPKIEANYLDLLEKPKGSSRVPDYGAPAYEVPAKSNSRSGSGGFVDYMNSRSTASTPSSPVTSTRSSSYPSSTPSSPRQAYYTSEPVSLQIANTSANPAYGNPAPYYPTPYQTTTSSYSPPAAAAAPAASASDYMSALAGNKPDPVWSDDVTWNKNTSSGGYLDNLKPSSASSYSAPSHSASAAAAAVPAPSGGFADYLKKRGGSPTPAATPSYSVPSYSAPATAAAAPADYMAALSGNKPAPKWVDDSNWTPPKSSGGDYLSNLKASPTSSHSAPSYLGSTPVAATPVPSGGFADYLKKRGGSHASAATPSYSAPSYSAPSKAAATPPASSGDYMAALGGNKPAPKWVDDNNWTAPKNSGGDYLSNLKANPTSSYSATSYSAPSYYAPAPASAAPARSFTPPPSYSTPAAAAAAPADYMAALSGNKPAPKWVDDNNWTPPKSSDGDYLSNLKASPASSYSSYSAPNPAAAAPVPSGGFADYLKKRGGSPASAATLSYSVPSYSAPATAAAAPADYMAALSGNKPAPKWVDDNNWTPPKSSDGDYLSNLKASSASSYSSYSAPDPAAAAPVPSGGFADYLKKRGGSPASATTPSYSVPSYSAPATAAAAPADYMAALSGNKPAPKWVDDNNWTPPKSSDGDYLSNLKASPVSSYSPLSHTVPAPAAAAPAPGSPFEEYMRKRGVGAAALSASTYSGPSDSAFAPATSSDDYMAALGGNKPAPRWSEDNNWTPKSSGGGDYLSNLGQGGNTSYYSSEGVAPTQSTNTAAGNAERVIVGRYLTNTSAPTVINTEKQATSRNNTTNSTTITAAVPYRTQPGPLLKPQLDNVPVAFWWMTLFFPLYAVICYVYWYLYWMI